MIDQQEILAAVARQTETILATLESRWMRRATAVVAGSRSLASADQPPLEAALAALPSRRFIRRDDAERFVDEAYDDPRLLQAVGIRGISNRGWSS